LWISSGSYTLRDLKRSDDVRKELQIDFQTTEINGVNVLKEGRKSYPKENFKLWPIRRKDQ
jgi:hypothetical protein